MKSKIQLSDHFTYGKLIRFVLPSIIMMVFTSIYGVVDGLFVSNFVGKAPFAAINLIMPFIMLFGGVGFMLGTGGSALVGKTLGQQEPEQANRYFSMMILTTLVVGIAISVLGIIFIRPVSIFLRADEEMLEHCVTYGRICLAFGPSFMLQNVFQGFLITAEKPKLGLLATVAAGITNMVLDAVLIAWLDMGVAGAALATGLSQCVGGILPLIYFLRKNDSLLRLVKTKFELRPVLRACGNGASEMVSNVTASVVGMVFNFQLLKYAGQDGVSAYGVLMYVEFIFAAVFIGYAVGSAPIISYHYGAGNTSELNNILKKSNIITAIGGVAVVALAQLLAPALAKLFVGYDQNLCDMTVHAFRISTFAFLMAGFNIFASSFFTALNNGIVSAVISFLRTFLFKLSAALILPLILALDGIWLSNPVAEVAACLLSIIFLFICRKKYRYF